VIFGLNTPLSLLISFSLSILYHSEFIRNEFRMVNIHSIDIPSWETGLHSEGIFYPEPHIPPEPDPEIDVIDS
jgi:hypothetical protein